MSQPLAQKYGMHTLTLAPMSEPGSGASNGAISGDVHKLLDPDNPMLWLLGIGAATLGLVAASTSLRVGPVRGSVTVGKG
jgi:hypothetical protein